MHLKIICRPVQIVGEYTFIQAESCDEVFKSQVQLKLCRLPPRGTSIFLELLDTNFFITHLVSIVLCAKKERFPAQKKEAHRTQLTVKKRPLLRFIAAPLIGGQPKKSIFLTTITPFNATLNSTPPILTEVSFFFLWKNSQRSFYLTPAWSVDHISPFTHYGSIRMHRMHISDKKPE